MKEIAEKLRLAREKTGISIEEAAEDLNFKVSQLEEIESGNYNNFKDKFVLKTIISDYAKYLGLDDEEVIDAFNDFVFETTSRIPIEEIEKAKKVKKDTDDKIASPYTATEEKKKFPLLIVIALSIILLVLVGFFTYRVFFSDTNDKSFEVSYDSRWLI